MNRLRNIGGVAALTLSALFIGLVVVLGLVLQAQGFGPSTLNDPAQGLALVRTSFVPTLIDGIYLGVALALPLTLLALADAAVPTVSSSRSVKAFAGLAGLLFLSYALIGLLGNPILTVHAQRALAEAEQLYLTLRSLRNILSQAALLATGLAVLVAARGAWVSCRLGRPLAGLLAGASITMALGVMVLPLGLLSILLTIIWAAWLGVALLWRGQGKQEPQPA